jgi:hypothetical protein
MGRFKQLAALEQPSIEALLHALARELGGRAAAASEERMARLAARLDGISRDPVAQIAGLARRVGGTFAVVPDALRRPDHDDLRPDVVLASRRGDELVIAMLVAAVAHRRGWDVDVVTSNRHAFVAHRECPWPLFVGPLEPGRVVDGRDLDDGDLRWRCPHELSADLLRRLEQRAERVGHRVLLAQARELALALPFDDATLEARRMALAQARAAWN